MHRFVRVLGSPAAACRATLLPVAMLLAVSACFSYRPTTAPVPGRAPVRIRLDSPRQVEVVFSRRDPMIIEDVTVVEGRVLSVSGDTLRVAPSRLRAGGGWRPLLLPERGTVALAPGGASRIEQRRFALEKVIGLGVLGVVVWGALAIAVASAN